MSNRKMYVLLCTHGKPLIEHNGPMSEVFRSLKLAHRAQNVTVAVFGILMMIAVIVRIENGAMTVFSNSCLISMGVAMMAFAFFEFFTLDEIRALSVVKQLFDDMPWKEFLLFLNDKSGFTRRVIEQLDQIRCERDDPCLELLDRVGNAMLLLTSHEVWSNGLYKVECWTA